jgi:arsenate reductase (glutaredoxin)
MITVYGIPNCDTVKKARAWLNDQQMAHDFHDFKKAGVPADHLAQWAAQLGWEKLLNRQGTTWRKLTPELQARVQDSASAQALMREPAQPDQAPGGRMGRGALLSDSRPKNGFFFLMGVALDRAAIPDLP